MRFLFVASLTGAAAQDVGALFTQQQPATTQFQPSTLSTPSWSSAAAPAPEVPSFSNSIFASTSSTGTPSFPLNFVAETVASRQPATGSVQPSAYPMSSALSSASRTYTQIQPAYAYTPTQAASPVSSTMGAVATWASEPSTVNVGVSASEDPFITKWREIFQQEAMGEVTTGQQIGGSMVSPSVMPMDSSRLSVGESELQKRMREANELAEARRFTPAWKWDAYKNSFQAYEGVPEHLLTGVERAILNVDSYLTMVINSEWVSSLQADAGSSPIKLSTFGGPSDPSKPIVPCPAGTPELVCTMTAQRLSYMFPQIQEPEEEEEYEYYFYQMLLREGYPGAGAPGFGGAIRPPPPPAGEYIPSMTVGPAPFPHASPQPLSCLVSVYVGAAFNLRDPMLKMRNREHALSMEYEFACACGPTNLPDWSQCRAALTGEASPNQSLPPAMLPYPLMWYNAEYLEAALAGEEAEVPPMQESFNPCGAYATFNPDMQQCNTVVIPGYTPTPPLPNAMFGPAVPQYPQIIYDGERGFPVDPYACSIYLGMSFYFESPLAWMNHYSHDLEYAQDNDLECLCDQLNNPIFSSCRMRAADDYPIPQNYYTEAPEPEPESTGSRSNSNYNNWQPPSASSSEVPAAALNGGGASPKMLRFPGRRLSEENTVQTATEEDVNNTLSLMLSREAAMEELERREVINAEAMVGALELAEAAAEEAELAQDRANRMLERAMRMADALKDMEKSRPRAASTTF